MAGWDAISAAKKGRRDSTSQPGWRCLGRPADVGRRGHTRMPSECEQQRDDDHVGHQHQAPEPRHAVAVGAVRELLDVHRSEGYAPMNQ